MMILGQQWYPPRVFSYLVEGWSIFRACDIDSRRVNDRAVEPVPSSLLVRPEAYETESTRYTILLEQKFYICDGSRGNIFLFESAFWGDLALGMRIGFLRPNETSLQKSARTSVV